MDECIYFYVFFQLLFVLFGRINKKKIDAKVAAGICKFCMYCMFAYERKPIHDSIEYCIETFCFSARFNNLLLSEK